MMKGSTFLFTCVAVATGIALFHIKYQVVSLEKDYTQTLEHIHDTQESIHVLRAEWAHLNDPRRLHDLSLKYLKIVPIQASQFIPMRRLAQNTKDYDQYALSQLISEVSDIAKHGDHTASQPRPTSPKLPPKNVPVSKQATVERSPKSHTQSPSTQSTYDPIGDLIDQNVRAVSYHPGVRGVHRARAAVRGA